jgi:hypothetical protein
MNYDYWSNALKGEFGAVHEGDPQPGFYRKRISRGGAFVPVAIWEHEGSIVALVDVKQTDAAELWSYVCQYPITEQQYHDRIETGKWHDESDAVTASLAPPSIGHNNGPQDEAEIIKGQIEAASAGAEEYATIKDDGEAAKAQSLRSRLLELSGSADKKREAEKKPHLEAGKSVDAKWQPLVKAAKAAADKIRDALSAHETRKAREAERLRREAEEAARKAEDERRAKLAAKLAEHPDAPSPMPELTPVPVAPEPVTAIRGAYGRAAAVKIVKVCTVIDQDAAYSYLKADKELAALISKLAQKAVDAGYVVPGTEVTEQRKVA